MVRDAHPIVYSFPVTLSSLLCSGRFVFLHGGDGPARADFENRHGTGLVASLDRVGVTGLHPPLLPHHRQCGFPQRRLNPAAGYAGHMLFVPDISMFGFGKAFG